jgi:hypothetical protein
MAKDVAAFASAHGGTLLVGAYGGTRLEHYKSVTADEAKEIAEGFDRAVRDRCAPAPLISTEVLPHDDGFVVAVNVHPFPGQLIGVRILQNDKKDLGALKGVEHLCFFPLRVGTHTKFIPPEQLPMFIDGKMRRIAIILQSAVDQQVALFDAFGSDRKTPYLDAANIRAVNPLTNSITFGVTRRGGETQFTLPLDLVETVCRQGSHWHVYLKGRMEELDERRQPADALCDVKFVFRASR